MKKPILLVLCLAFSFYTVHAQDNELPESVTVVMSMNKCQGTDLGKLYKMTEELSGPVMNEIVDEGHWMNWGVLTHDWGDEWNFNIFYVAKDKESFFKGWKMFVGKMIKNHPNSMSEYQDMIIAHRDNIYHQSMGYPWMKKKMAENEEEGEKEDGGEE